MDLRELDPLVHAPVRLAIMASLVPVEALEFTTLRDQVGTTDGNLATHLKKLERAGYLVVHKHSVGRKTRSMYSLTEDGRVAFERHLTVLEKLLGLGRM